MKQYHVSNTAQLSETIDAIAQSREAGEVFLEEGVYELTSSLQLPNHVTLRGVKGKTFLKGSKSIAVPDPGQDGISVIDLKQAGITDFGAFGEGPFEDFWKKYDIPKPHMCDQGPGLELFYQGKKLPLSRYPKEGFLSITKALGQTDTYHGENRNGSKEGIFQCNDPRVKDWANESELLLVGYWGNDWATQRHTVKSVDPVTGTIEVNPPYHCFGYRDGKTYMNEEGAVFYALNVKGALQQPGEWCIDRENGLLYLIPLPGQREVSVSVCHDLIFIEGREDIKIKGITFCECRGCGVMARSSSRVRLYECEAYDTGAWGFLAEDCTQCKFARCKVHHTGGGGIGVGGGDREMLTPSGNLVEQCEITQIAWWHKTYLPAIELTGVGCCARGNRIYNVPHFGILYQGNNHVIEYNEIDNACYESNDAGGIYAGRDWTCRGTVIRYNYIHDMAGAKGGGCTGIYFDDGVSSAQVYGNILVGFTTGAILLGGGRDYHIHHNTFYGCGVSMRMDCRVRDWGDRLYPTLCRHLEEMPWLGNTWAKAYPALATIMASQPRLPLGNEFDHNTIIGGAGVMVGGEGAEEYLYAHDNTAVNLDPDFTHPHFTAPYWKKLELK